MVREALLASCSRRSKESGTWRALDIEGSRVETRSGFWDDVTSRRDMKRFLAVLAGLLIVMGATAAAASAKTIHLFSKNISNEFFDPNGNPFMDPNAEPPVGSYFIGVDDVYKGNHRKHSRKRAGSDHIICTLLDPARSRSAATR
jgi:hypothetical protein